MDIYVQIYVVHGSGIKHEVHRGRRDSTGIIVVILQSVALYSIRRMAMFNVYLMTGFSESKSLPR